jgi:hypothetical protein
MPILCILFLVAMTASRAQSGMFYKCVSPAGAVSYQQAPCSGKDKAAWSRDLPSDTTPSHSVPKTPAEAAREHDANEAERRAKLAKQAVAGAGPKPGQDKRSPQQKRCDEANVARDAWERQVGGAPDLERLRALNNVIFEACKGL